MIEHDLDIETSDGLMNTFVTHPEEGGPFPVVLLLMDAIGKREELHDWARRIATVGYFVLLPNLFYRHARDYTPAWLDAENLVERMFEDIDTLSNAMVVEDCKALLNYADQQVETNRGPVAVIGISMSGAFAFAAAAEIPDRIKAAASICGIRLHTDTADSPHVDAEKIRGEMYFACAEDDKHIPREMIDSLDAYLKKPISTIASSTIPERYMVFTIQFGMKIFTNRQPRDFGRGCLLCCIEHFSKCFFAKPRRALSTADA